MAREFMMMIDTERSGMVETALQERGYIRDLNDETRVGVYVHRRNHQKTVLVDKPLEPEIAEYNGAFEGDPQLVADPKWIVCADPGVNGGSDNAIARREREMRGDMEYVRASLTQRGCVAHLYLAEGPRQSQTIVPNRLETI